MLKGLIKKLWKQYVQHKHINSFIIFAVLMYWKSFRICMSDFVTNGSVIEPCTRGFLKSWYSWEKRQSRPRSFCISFAGSNDTWVNLNTTFVTYGHCKSFIWKITAKMERADKKICPKSLLSSLFNFDDF